MTANEETSFPRTVVSPGRFHSIPTPRKLAPDPAPGEGHSSAESDLDFYGDQDDDIILPINPADLITDEQDEEGTYSDDEVFAHGLNANSRSSLPVSSPSWTFPTEMAGEGLPEVKPTFESNAFPAESLELDEKQRDISVPAPINRFLKEYQKEGVRFLYGKYAAGKGGVLGDDMG